MGGGLGEVRSVYILILPGFGIISRPYILGNTPYPRVMEQPPLDVDVVFSWKQAA